MNRTARLVISCAIVLGPCLAQAQPTLRPTPPPSVTAENELWYQNGEPVMFSGILYYRAGPRVHFNGNEMVRSGSFQGVPLYSRTTIEPFSIVYVPLPGLLMQPYERRRTGEMAGTSGSSAPSFPVVSPAEIALTMAEASPIVQAPAPPMLASPILFDEMPLRPAATVPLGTSPPQLPSTAEPVTPAPLPVGKSVRTPAPARRSATRLPQAANGVFIEFDKTRWFSSGPTTLFDAKIFRRVGELRGVPVYTMRGRPATIFVPVAEGLDLLAPYSKRDSKPRAAKQ